MSKCHVLLFLKLKDGQLTPVGAGYCSDSQMGITRMGGIMPVCVWTVEDASYQEALDGARQVMESLAEYDPEAKAVLDMIGRPMS